MEDIAVAIGAVLLTCMGILMVAVLAGLVVELWRDALNCWPRRERRKGWLDSKIHEALKTDRAALSSELKHWMIDYTDVFRKRLAALEEDEVRLTALEKVVGEQPIGHSEVGVLSPSIRDELKHLHERTWRHRRALTAIEGYLAQKPARKFVPERSDRRA